MSDYDITEQSAGVADTDYVLGSDVTEWATGQRLRELKAAEQERDALRECVEALCGEYADACELTEHYQAQLEETETERGLFGDERDALRAEVGALRAALEHIANCGALTEQRMDRVSASEHDTLRLVKKIARAALAQPSKAGKRWAAMEAVCRAAREWTDAHKACMKAFSEFMSIPRNERGLWPSPADFREPEKARALVDAVDALTALDKAEKE